MLVLSYLCHDIGCTCRHGRFIIDLLATVPFVYLLVILGDENFSGSASSRWLVVLSLVRLLRLARLVSISKVLDSCTCRVSKHILAGYRYSAAGIIPPPPLLPL